MEPVNYDESVDGIFSADRLNPTEFLFGIGTNVIRASQGGSENSVDYFTITIPEGSNLVSIRLSGFTGATANLAFIGVQEGDSFTEPASGTNPANLLGGTTYGSADSFTNILDDIGDGGVGQGFSGPLGPGTYTFWLNQTGARTSVQLDFEVESTLSTSPTEGNDTIVGTEEDNTIDGLGGDDIISGLGGRDLITGGSGNDEIDADAGNDVIFGGTGTDQINGGEGFDFLDYQGSATSGVILDFSGQSLNVAGGFAEGDLIANVENVRGSNFDDVITLGNGVVGGQGGDGDDRITGNDTDDNIGGDAGIDVLNGGAGDDLISGGSGDDIVNGGGGADNLFGGTGNDIVSGGFGNDTLTGNFGTDTVLGDDAPSLSTYLSESFAQDGRIKKMSFLNL